MHIGDTLGGYHMEARVVKFKLKRRISGVTGRCNLDRTLVQHASDTNATMTGCYCNNDRMLLQREDRWAPTDKFK